MHTDIKPQKWIEVLPEKCRPYAVLMRLDRPIGSWLLFLPCLWSVLLAYGGLQNLTLYGVYLCVLFGIGAVAMRGAGCIINDLWDKDFDAQVERTKTRPLASGVIKPYQAFFLLFFLAFIGFLILLQTSWTAIFLGILSLPFIIAYPYMKRITWWPQIFLGLTINFGALIGWASVHNSLSLSALFLYIGGIFWTLGYDTVYAHQDKQDDALIGLKSSALKLGSKSKLWVFAFYGLSLLCFALSLIVHSFFDWPLIALLVLLLPAFFIGWYLIRWDIDNPAQCLKIFKANKIFGILIALSVALSGF